VQVSRTFNSNCGEMLTRGFKFVCEEAERLSQRIKLAMPRGSWLKLNHQLCYNWILSEVVCTQIMWLECMYEPWIVGGNCPFVPGKVCLAIAFLIYVMKEKSETLKKFR
jgi:hypothetical protein